MLEPVLGLLLVFGLVLDDPEFGLGPVLPPLPPPPLPFILGALGAVEGVAGGIEPMEGTPADGVGTGRGGAGGCIGTVDIL